MAVLHTPHPQNTKLKRVHRLVVSPDYQGIGIGTKFLDIVANKYISNGFDFSIMTSAKNLINALNHKNNWQCVRYGRSSKYNNATAIKAMHKTERSNVISATFFYKKDKSNL